MQTHIHLHEISRPDTLPMRESCHICIKLDFDTAGNTSLKLAKSKAALQTYAPQELADCRGSRSKRSLEGTAQEIQQH